MRAVNLSCNGERNTTNTVVNAALEDTTTLNLSRSQYIDITAVDGLNTGKARDEFTQTADDLAGSLDLGINANALSQVGTETHRLAGTDGSADSLTLAGGNAAIGDRVSASGFETVNLGDIDGFSHRDVHLRRNHRWRWVARRR